MGFLGGDGNFECQTEETKNEAKGAFEDNGHILAREDGLIT